MLAGLQYKIFKVFVLNLRCNLLQSFHRHLEHRLLICLVFLHYGFNIFIGQFSRLTYLIPELLELVDEEKIALTPAVELSYLTDEEQYALLDAIELEERTPSLSQAVRFKKLSQTGELSYEDIETIMQEDKANQKPMFKVSMERLQKVAPKVKDKDFEDFVLKACEHYYRYLQRQRNRDAR